MAKGGGKNKGRVKSKKKIFKNFTTSLLEREGCTFADAATAGRARKAAEKADYPTLKRTAAATLEKLKKAQLAKRREARVRKSAEQAAEEERQLLARERVLRADLK